MECGVIYIKVVPPKGHKSEWIKYCYLSSMMPADLQNEIKELADLINTRHQADIVIPMDTMIHPGCTTKPEVVEEIAREMYNGFIKIFSTKIGVDCIRCVYSVGELSNVNVGSTHKLYHSSEKGYDEVMIKLGRYLDSSDTVGIFRV